jgi:preprotein translocase subunit YajC
MTSLVLAQATTPAGGFGSFLPLILVAGVFVMIMLPQRRMRRQQAELQSSLEVGDTVRTAGGVHGRIISMDDTTVVLELEDGRLRMDRRAVMGKIKTEP